MQEGRRRTPPHGLTRWMGLDEGDLRVELRLLEEGRSGWSTLTPDPLTSGVSRGYWKSPKNLHMHIKIATVGYRLKVISKNKCMGMGWGGGGGSFSTQKKQNSSKHEQGDINSKAGDGRKSGK